MSTRVRVGSGRAGEAASRGPARQARGLPDTMSAYGTANSMGFNPGNPHAYLATQGAKGYKQDKGTEDWDGPKGISPPIKVG